MVIRLGNVLFGLHVTKTYFVDYKYFDRGR
jgi:hypothetical protein